MKNLLSILFLSTILFTVQANTSEEDFQAIRLVICSSTTAEDIRSMQQFMVDNGYSLEIDEITYGEDGFVDAVSGKVDFGKSSGSFSTDDLKGKVIVISRSLFNSMRIEVKVVE